MGFHYGRERKKFENDWIKRRREYIAVGMSESDAQVMYDYDWEHFKHERIFRIHNQALEGAQFPDGDAVPEDHNPLLKKYLERLSVQQPEISEWSRYNWIEDLDTPELARRIKSLPPETLELLSCLVVDGLSRAEIARQLGVSRTAITKRLNRIKNILGQTGFSG